MCACTETDVRETANDCTFASGEGPGSRGETILPLYAARPVSSSGELTVLKELQQSSVRKDYRIYIILYMYINTNVLVHVRLNILIEERSIPSSRRMQIFSFAEFRRLCGLFTCDLSKVL
jgi:hypothetical protein